MSLCMYWAWGRGVGFFNMHTLTVNSIFGMIKIIWCHDGHHDKCFNAICSVKWGAHSFLLPRFLCTLKKKYSVFLSPYRPVLFCGSPFLLHAMPRQTVYVSQRHKKIKYFISERASWTTLWLAMTSYKPISLTTRLAFNPNLWAYDDPDASWAGTSDYFTNMYMIVHLRRQ